MEKEIWKEWDAFLIDAWMKDAPMFNVVWQFLLLHAADITLKRLEIVGAQEIFAGLGVTSRSPKTVGHLYGPVKAFFHQFFPQVNELLWQGKRDEALRAMRRYRVSEEALEGDREIKKIKRNFGRKKPAGTLRLIPGTNAVLLMHARIEKPFDWGIVKPPARQRKGRLP